MAAAAARRGQGGREVCRRARARDLSWWLSGPTRRACRARSDSFYYHDPEPRAQEQFKRLLTDIRQPEGQLLERWRQLIDTTAKDAVSGDAILAFLNEFTANTMRKWAAARAFAAALPHARRRYALVREGYPEEHVVALVNCFRLYLDRCRRAGPFAPLTLLRGRLMFPRLTLSVTWMQSAKERELDERCARARADANGRTGVVHSLARACAGYRRLARKSWLRRLTQAECMIEEQFHAPQPSGGVPPRPARCGRCRRSSPDAARPDLLFQDGAEPVGGGAEIPYGRAAAALGAMRNEVVPTDILHALLSAVRLVNTQAREYFLLKQKRRRQSLLDQLVRVAPAAGLLWRARVRPRRRRWTEGARHRRRPKRRAWARAPARTRTQVPCRPPRAPRRRLERPSAPAATCGLRRSPPWTSAPTRFSQLWWARPLPCPWARGRGADGARALQVWTVIHANVSHLHTSLGLVERCGCARRGPRGPSVSLRGLRRFVPDNVKLFGEVGMSLAVVQGARALSPHPALPCPALPLPADSTLLPAAASHVLALRAEEFPRIMATVGPALLLAYLTRSLTVSSPRRSAPPWPPSPSPNPRPRRQALRPRRPFSARSGPARATTTWCRSCATRG